MNYNVGMRNLPKCRNIQSKSLDLCILQWNAGGLSQAKKMDIQKTLLEHNIDVFAIMEANLTEESIKYFTFQGYRLYLLPKFRQVASGILVGVKDNITTDFEIIKTMGETSDKSEIIRLKVWRNKNIFKIYAAYIPPGSKPDLSILNIDQKTILIGDLNAHSKRWGYQDYNAAGLEVEDALNSTPLELIFSVEDPHTYLHYNGSSSTPDLLCVSSDISNYTKRKIIEDPGSGHRQILALINIPCSLANTREIRRISWNFKKANWEGFTDSLEYELSEENLDFNCHPDKLISKLNKLILKCAGANIPRGKMKIYKHFWTPDLVEAKEKRDRLRRKAEITKRKCDVTSWRRQVGLFRKAILDAKRKSFDEFITKVSYREDSLKVYKFLASIQNKRPVPKKEPIFSGGKYLTSHRDIANAFGSIYAQSQRKGSYARKMSKYINIEWKKRHRKTNSETSAEHNEIFSSPFGRDELNLVLKCLKTKKSPGVDHIHAEFLGHLGEVARDSLLRAFNYIWEVGLVPSIWRKAIVIPVLKKNKDPKLINSYRPISLTSIMGKTMERLLTNRLNWYLEHKNLLANEQAGFRKNKSTNDHVTLLSQVIKDALDKRNILTAVFVDFRNAYDSIWKERLFLKLQDLGITSKMLNWFRSFLGQRICKVKYGDEFSRFFHLQTGLPQGAVSSCSLFNIYINDLIKSLKSLTDIKCLLFADDLVIWTQAPKKNAKNIIEKRLNDALGVLSGWCRENNMTVSLEKTASQSFSLTHQNIRPDLKYESKSIENTDVFTYLGVTFDRKLTWENHINLITERFSKRLNILKRLAGATWGCARSTLNTTYKTFILPLMTYCCEPLITVSNTLLKKLETLQNQALRLIVGAVKSTPIDAMLSLTQNRPILKIIEERASILYEKLIRSEDIFWRDYQLEVRNLKSQDGFIQRVLANREIFEFSNEVQLLMKPRNPRDAGNVETNIGLTQLVSKKDTSIDILKCLAIETIETTYPENEWLHVYTDGSQISRHTNVGAGVFCDLFAFYTPFGRFGSAFDGEVEAIRIALKQLSCILWKFEKAVLLSDSRAAIQAIGSLHAPLTEEVAQCQEILRCLDSQHKRIALQWIPGHCSLRGNDQADFLAKKGAKLSVFKTQKISFYSAKQYIRQYTKAHYQQVLKNKIESKYGRDWASDIPDKPRRQAVAAIRLSTGHDCLAAHLYRLGIFDNPACPLCSTGEPMDKSHLLSCKALRGETEAARYWEARCILGR